MCHHELAAEDDAGAAAAEPSESRPAKGKAPEVNDADKNEPAEDPKEGGEEELPENDECAEEAKAEDVD